MTAAPTRSYYATAFHHTFPKTAFLLHVKFQDQCNRKTRRDERIKLDVTVLAEINGNCVGRMFLNEHRRTLYLLSGRLV